MPRNEQDTFNVTFELPDGRERTISAHGDEYVLAAARRAGLDLPSRCEVGWDLACAVRVLDGELDHSDAQRYFPADRQAGFALICRATPRSDLRLRTHQGSAMRDHRLAHRLPTPYAV
ncbi:2Fe-2S iron-sulfur cluster-binding protein [Pseudonocardia hispaniensis]|uniref:2Fe-2S iron-sulfur cluster-binding protein n=1 Tax=Pseudonocardia hispaniensis TaxID=904933 RepID=A0ABW1J457_9PSEU